MKSNSRIVIFIILLSLILILTSTITSAQSDMPDGYIAFYPSDNLTCLDKDGEFLGCWCCEDDGDCKSVDPTPKPSKNPDDPTATPKEPDSTSTPQPELTSTPKPEKTKKTKCNSGRGNGFEYYWNGEKWVECDPGKSGTQNEGGG